MKRHLVIGLVGVSLVISPYVIQGGLAFGQSQTWTDRESVVRFFDLDTRSAVDLLEDTIEKTQNAADIPAAFEGAAAGPFLPLPNWFKYRFDRKQLVEQYGEDSPQVRAFDAGVAAAVSSLGG